MPNGDLYPRGKRLFHKGLRVQVEYVCCAGNGLHIVLAPPLDCLDDRVREVSPSELVDEAVLCTSELESRQVDPEFIGWLRRYQVSLYQKYQQTLGRLEERGYLPEGITHDGGFMFFAVFQFEASKLRGQMAPGSKTHQ